jgi:hypothetical protein
LLSLVTVLGFIALDRGSFSGFSVNAQNVNMPTCNYNLFPVYMGGSSNEKVGCFLYDPKN